MSRSFFWLHIKKAGGQSVRELLKDLYVETDRSVPTPFIALPREQWNDALNNFRMPLGPYDFKRVLFARNFLYGREQFERMYKFAVIRNPYDRIVSAYLYLTSGGPKWKAYRLLGKKRAFLEFLKRLPDLWSEVHKCKYRHVATHTAPIVPDISDEDGNILLDRLFHLEYIENELEELARVLDLDSVSLPHKNRGGERRGEREYRKYYSNEIRREVERLYKDDVERLGYDF